MTEPMIWVLLPAFNEEDSLPVLLPRIDEAFRARNRRYHMVVVDDGSTDSTPDLLEEYARRFPISVVTHPINRGLGETERDGFEYIARRCQPGDVIVRLDCDDTHNPEYLFSMEEKLDKGHDVVNTSRFQPGGGQKGVHGYRAFVSYGANLFMAILYQIKNVRDYSCGFRAYRGRVIQDAIRLFGNNFIQLRGLGFTSTLEMIVKLNILGCRFAEVPFVLRYDMKRSPSKMIGSLTTLGYLIMTVLYYWPFDGWLMQYRGLSRLYRENPEEAIARFRKARLKTTGRISI